MAYTYKVLGEGRLPDSKGTLCSVSANAEAAIRSIFIYNDGSGSNTVTIYLKPGAASRKIARFLLDADEYAVLADVGTLEAGDLIEGEASNANEVDYVVTGAEVMA